MPPAGYLEDDGYQDRSLAYQRLVRGLLEAQRREILRFRNQARSTTRSCRLFSHISTNWRGRPLVSHQVIVELLAATQAHAGLKVRAALDRHSYPLGVRISDRDLAAVPLHRHGWHGEWNYTALPAAA